MAKQDPSETHKISKKSPGKAKTQPSPQKAKGAPQKQNFWPKTGFLTLLALVLALFLGAGYLLWSQKLLLRSPFVVMPSAKITFILGHVHIRKEGHAWRQAQIGMTLGQGDELRTSEQSKADLVFHPKMALRLPENTLFQLDQANIRRLQLKLKQGSLYGIFEKIFQDYKIGINTPTTSASVRGTDLAFRTEPPGKSVEATTIFALSGITEIYNPTQPEQKLLLSYRQKARVSASAPPENPQSMGQQEITHIRRVLNSIHFQEVIEVSQKILFRKGSAKLLPSSHEELKRIADKIQQSSHRIRIEGHTDNQGTAHFNQRLSVRRAQSVRRFLIQQGISGNKLRSKGYGSAKPIADNSTPQGRKRNRRVAFVIID